MVWKDAGKASIAARCSSGLSPPLASVSSMQSHNRWLPISPTVMPCPCAPHTHTHSHTASPCGIDTLCSGLRSSRSPFSSLMCVLYVTVGHGSYLTCYQHECASSFHQYSMTQHSIEQYCIACSTVQPDQNSMKQHSTAWHTVAVSVELTMATRYQHDLKQLCITRKHHNSTAQQHSAPHTVAHSTA